MGGTGELSESGDAQGGDADDDDFDDDDDDFDGALRKRSYDYGTAGGNAYSGAASDSSGGDVQNESTDGTLTNDDGSSECVRL